MSHLMDRDNAVQGTLPQLNPIPAKKLGDTELPSEVAQCL